MQYYQRLKPETIQIYKHKDKINQKGEAMTEQASITRKTIFLKKKKMWQSRTNNKQEKETLL